MAVCHNLDIKMKIHVSIDKVYIINDKLHVKFDVDVSIVEPSQKSGNIDFSQTDFDLFSTLKIASSLLKLLLKLRDFKF